MRPRATSLFLGVLRAGGAGILAAALAGCVVGPDYEHPSVALPAAWSVAAGGEPEAPEAPARCGEPAALERWWATFEDPLLDRLVARAVEGNLDLRIASARIREARAARGIAAARGRPRVEAAAGYARTGRSEAIPPFDATAGPSSPFGPRQQDLFELGFDASWEIDVFGGVRRDREAALAQVEAAQEERRDVLVTLVAEVARSYVDLRAAQRQLELLDDTLRSQQDTLSLVQARAEAGLASDLDVARAEGLVASTAARRPRLARLAAEAMHRIGVLLGQPPGALVAELAAPAPLPPAPPSVPATLPSELLSRRPDLRRAERDLAAATARIGVARADLFPRFAILGSLGRRSDESAELGDGTSTQWGIAPGVRWPLLQGGRIRANIRVETARQEQAHEEYAKAILIALEETLNALEAHHRERERYESLGSEVVAQRRALDLSLERYTAGLETFLSVLDAQRSLYAADEALVESRRELASSMIAIYKSLGGGWSANPSS